MLWYLCYVLFIDILIKMIDMISLQEAISIAQEYCDGDILDGSVDTIIPSSSKTPISWVFTIYHKDYDSNVFKTIVEVDRNGSVLQWYKNFISDGSY